MSWLHKGSVLSALKGKQSKAIPSKGPSNPIVSKAPHISKGGVKVPFSKGGPKVAFSKSKSQNHGMPEKRKTFAAPIRYVQNAADVVKCLNRYISDVKTTVLTPSQQQVLVDLDTWQSYMSQQDVHNWTRGDYENVISEICSHQQLELQPGILKSLIAALKSSNSPQKDIPTEYKSKVETILDYTHATDRIFRNGPYSRNKNEDKQGFQLTKPYKDTNNELVIKTFQLVMQHAEDSLDPKEKTINETHIEAAVQRILYKTELKQEIQEFARDKLNQYDSIISSMNEDKDGIPKITQSQKRLKKPSLKDNLLKKQKISHDQPFQETSRGKGKGKAFWESKAQSNIGKQNTPVAIPSKPYGKPFTPKANAFGKKTFGKKTFGKPFTPKANALGKKTIGKTYQFTPKASANATQNNTHPPKSPSSNNIFIPEKQFTSQTLFNTNTITNNSHTMQNKQSINHSLQESIDAQLEKETQSENENAHLDETQLEKETSSENKDVQLDETQLEDKSKSEDIQLETQLENEDIQLETPLENEDTKLNETPLENEDTKLNETQLESPLANEDTQVNETQLENEDTELNETQQETPLENEDTQVNETQLENEDTELNKTQQETPLENEDTELNETQQETPLENEDTQVNETQLENEDTELNETQLYTPSEDEDTQVNETQLENEDTQVNETQLETPLENEDTQVNETQLETPLENEDTQVNETQLETPLENEDTQVNETQLETPLENEDTQVNETPLENEDTNLNETQLETPLDIDWEDEILSNDDHNSSMFEQPFKKVNKSDEPMLDTFPTC
jgi:hypothetical protein